MICSLLQSWYFRWFNAGVFLKIVGAPEFADRTSFLAKRPLVRAEL